MVKRGLVLAAASFLMAGCLGPDYARISNELRAKNIVLQQDLVRQKELNRDLNATVAVLNEQLDAKTPRMETLSQNKLDEIFTVDHVELQSSTTIWDSNGDGKADGYRVFVRPYCSDGTVLPATGKLTIEAFDLALQEGSRRVGSWAFLAQALKNKWYSGFGLDHFALMCPWSEPPAHKEITFKVHFIDALTGRAFEDQKLIKLQSFTASTQTAKTP